MKRVAIAVAAILAVVLGVVYGQSGQAGWQTGADETLKSVANSILDNILSGISEKDYAKFSRDFDESMRKALPEEKFQETQSGIAAATGKYQARDFIAVIHKPVSNSFILLWRGSFVGNKDEVLIELVLKSSMGKYLVSGLWFK